MNWSVVAWTWIGVGTYCLIGAVFHRPAMCARDAAGWIACGAIILVSEVVKELVARK